MVSLTGSSQKRVNSILIKRKSPIPISQTKVFYTAVKNQKAIQLEITEGEDIELDYVKIIANFMLSLPDGLNERTPVNITYYLDINQILHIYTKIEGPIPYEKECVFDRLSNKTEDQLLASKALISEIEVF